MTIFPKRTGATGAEPRASASPGGANAQGAGAGAAASAANSTEQKPHRFDKFARRMGESMIEAIRVTLSVFSSPDKERWPAVKLLDYLKSAEELARDMLREIAEKIFIAPAKFREQSRQGAFSLADDRREYAPYFRLGVKPEKDNSPVEEEGETCLHRHPGLRAAQDRDLLPLDAEAEAGGPPNKSADDDASYESLFSRRLSALQDVLTHPGKHAARMARALYRAVHDDGARLIAKSPNDVLLDKINLALAAHMRGEDAKTRRLRDEVMAFDTS